MPRAANLDTNDAMVEGACVFLCGREEQSAEMPMEAQTEVLSTTWQWPRHTHTDLQTKLKTALTGGSYVSTCLRIDSCWPADGLMDQKHANGKAPYLLVVLTKPLANSTLCFSFA